jgi:hypothetical protein
MTRRRRGATGCGSTTKKAGRKPPSATRRTTARTRYWIAGEPSCPSHPPTPKPPPTLPQPATRTTSATTPPAPASPPTCPATVGSRCRRAPPASVVTVLSDSVFRFRFCFNSQLLAKRHKRERDRACDGNKSHKERGERNSGVAPWAFKRVLLKPAMWVPALLGPTTFNAALQKF